MRGLQIPCLWEGNEDEYSKSCRDHSGWKRQMGEETGMPRNYGIRGAQNLEVICEDAYNMGIRYLTVYLFQRRTGNVLEEGCADEAVPQIYKDVYQDGA